ncbi:phytoene desaturase [Chloropicon primus]|uniref:Phytoene desaturase n=1 Tax=Chloropicon primus TaxID=1764295 RepID=A0A5B8MX89_9CHLO|nr:phytoene desaturase [Chloropicon primus]UPR04615.1 phytoene desaturase [Chloropicon primus]|mmetsp:Transcript_14194/g.40236  ORF Transcript_14194/g.40236 Transcript_14194/m.40236 type:complete len:533 (-) Transcript_14194:646-2244(-)|eukprot:QDZ25418.1 phytoene desaturase [Chloropicon primus]
MSGGKSAVVVGGGVGGLSSAIRLKKSGAFERVTIIEKNGTLGGRVKSLTLTAKERSGARYRFDTGPSLGLFPQEYRRSFEEDLEAKLPELLKVEPIAYRVYFGDEGRLEGSRTSYLDLLTDEEEMSVQLEGVERGAGDSFKRMLRSSRATLDVGVGAFIDRNFSNLGDFLNLPRLFSLLPRLFQGGIANPFSLLMPLDTWLKQYFKDPRIRSLFTFQTLYVGLSPFTAPSAFSLLAATELSDGVFFPKGGFGEIITALEEKAASVGVAIEVGKEVSRISVSEDGGSVVGVETGCGLKVAADIVLVNADLPFAKSKLLKRKDGRNNPFSMSMGGVDKTREYSAGIVEFCWGIRDDLEALQQHNVFLSSDFVGSWFRPGSRKDLPADGNFYVHVPSKTDPTAATEEGTHSLMILFPVANKAELSSPHAYEDLVDWSRKVVLKRFREIGLDVEEKIEVESATDPEDWQKMYNLVNGSAFGLSHGLDQLAYFRPSNKDDEVEGLFYVGASTHPGNGVPLVLKGSRLVCERILESLR